MVDVTICAQAYCKIMLHAAKYPHCAVNGVLLADPTKSKNKEVHFVDAVPLFHLSLNLTPMAEIALTQIDQLVSSAGLVIGGYYSGSENINDNTLERASHRIADKIAENFSSACLVIIDNSKMSTIMDHMALKVASYNAGKFQMLDSQRVKLSPSCSMEACSHLLQKQSYKLLVDFDNHLDDLSIDWRNPGITEHIKDVLKLCGF